MSSPFGSGAPGPPGPFGGGPVSGTPYGAPATGGPADVTAASPFGGPPTGGTSDSPFGGPSYGGSPFGLAPIPSAPHATVAASAPVQWLAAGALLAVLALVAALLFGGTVAVAIAAWLVAGPAVIGLLAYYTLRQTRALALPFATRPSSGLRLAYAGVVVLAFSAVLMSAWRIAEWVGRL